MPDSSSARPGTWYRLYSGESERTQEQTLKLASLEAIVRALNQADVPFLVVGGLAVVAHGYGRQTLDVDIVIRLEPRTIEAAFGALASLGYRPTVPITAAQFADAELRAEWIRSRNMTVLNFHSDQHRETGVDLFVSEPFDFAREYDAALVEDLGPGVTARILRLDALIRMKERAGRPQDLADVAELRLLHGKRDDV